MDVYSPRGRVAGYFKEDRSPDDIPGILRKKKRADREGEIVLNIHPQIDQEAVSLGYDERDL